MTIKRIAGVLGALALGLGAMLALASPAQAQSNDPAFAHGQPAFTATAGAECGTVDITFTNPTPWLFVFDVRVDGEDALNPSVAEGVTIGEGPLAGQEFGPRWRLVTVDGSAGQHEVTRTFAFGQGVEVRLAEGAEQKLFFDFAAVDTSAVEECPTAPDTSTDCEAYEGAEAWCEEVPKDDSYVQDRYNCDEIGDEHKPINLIDPADDPFNIDGEGQIVDDGIACELPDGNGGGSGQDGDQSDAAAGGGHLPETGVPTLALLAVGGVVVIVGVFCVYALRRRRITFTA